MNGLHYDRTLKRLVWPELQKTEQWARDIASAWNGEDVTYTHEGVVYDEDAAHCAADIVKRCCQLGRY
jgi:hypothetical protein